MPGDRPVRNRNQATLTPFDPPFPTAVPDRFSRMTRRRLAVLALTLVSAAHAGAQQPSIESRLEGFDDYVTHLIETWNAPGLGIGIAVKDRLVFAKGYGYRDF